MDPDQEEERLGGREWIQSSILETMLRDLGPKAVEELLPRCDSNANSEAVSDLISRYAKDKNFDRAISLVNESAREEDFPYGAASQLMLALPPERASDR